MKSSTRFTKILPLLLVVGLAACAEQMGWEPTVDQANDPHAKTLNADLATCKQLASKAADQTTSVAEDTGIGTVAGAAGGALIGAMVGAPATGAGIGAASGAGLGFGGGAFGSDTRYKNAYISCLKQRGHTVIN